MFVLSTIQSINDKMSFAFEIIENISVGVFTVEYIIRLWVCIEKKKYRSKGWIIGRLFYIIQWHSIIDLIAIVPYYIIIIMNIILTTNLDIDFLAAIRALRILQLFRSVQTLPAVFEIFVHFREAIIMGTFLGLMLFFVTSTLMYYAERFNNPNIFGNVLLAMYPTLVMLTGQGLPDVELTLFGRIVVAASCVFSIAVFAVPAGIFGFGFQEIANHMG